MPDRGKNKTAGRTGDSKHANCCAVEAIVTVDERGQMVLPKDLRQRAGIKAGDKLAVASWEKDGTVCCITLVRSDSLETMMKSVLEPLIKRAL